MLLPSLGRAAAGAVPDSCVSEGVADLLAATFKITNKDSSGTCFLVAPPPGSGRPENVAVVVTSAHVLEAWPGQECVIVMREKRGDSAYARKEVTLKIRSGDKPLWVKHPAADVAAIKLTVPAGVWCRPLRLEQLARKEDFTNGNVRLGSGAWIFSFPVQMEANEAGFPVLRHGSVASLPLPPLETNQTFLVDFSTFGGDSGAAVLAGETDGPQAHALVVGVVMGMRRETDKVSMPFEERTVHHPLGLAEVLHSVFVRQAVERALRHRQ